MKYTLTTGPPDSRFWDRYATLWGESSHPSPFQAPHILRYFAEQDPDHVLVFSAELNGVLLGATLLLRSGKVLAFLSDRKTDANFFILHRDCDPAQLRAFFSNLLATMKREGWALMLNHKAAWADYMAALEEALKVSSLYWLQMDQSACPVAEGDTPEALHQAVAISRNTRYKVNKFMKMEGAGLEVLDDARDMDQWVADFCDAHVGRWAPTATPSSYRRPDRREFLKGCLRAWHADGALVRFAITAQGRRVGLVAGLREGETLIYHTPTYDRAFSDHSPGRVLIYYITQWMARNQLRILDFGDGREQYKYFVATREQVLQRIFVSAPTNAPFIIRSQAIRFVRRNKELYDLYQNKLKPTLRQWRKSRK